MKESNNDQVSDAPRPIEPSSPKVGPAASEQALLTLLEEYRKDRIWRRWSRLGVGVILIGTATAIVLLSGLEGEAVPETFTAVVEVSGVIGIDDDSSASALEAQFENAFAAPGTQGVVALINSPGGSPVQSGQLHRGLRRLRDRYAQIPLYAVITDIGASGGYYVAVAAERIFVDPASIVGSIGVAINGFGFVDSLEKLGVERRVLIAGEHKAMLDPFSPSRPQEQGYLQVMLDTIHQQFIRAVKAGRGDRLSEDPEVFSGRVWTGEHAISIGLADGFGSAREVARDVVGAPEIVDFSAQPNWKLKLLDQLELRVMSVLKASASGSDLRLY
ncbi:MAG TPA: S49 family peptidase [Arenicellales bacterium]|nr:S49 family peptidase [Arenicellales bacterium]